MDRSIPLPAYRLHERRWADHRFVYAVVSRRSGGVSIGINLNPDKACNFDCIYCQVDRDTAPKVREVDLPELARELDAILTAERDGSLYAHAPFDAIPADRRGVRDLAFSGDGEPTTYPRFGEAVTIAADARRRFGLAAAKLVLITDACYLARPAIRAALEQLDANNGEIWAKLDAGTESYYELVNRPNVPLQHVLDNILDAARRRPIVIQSLFMRVRDEPPPDAEVAAYADRLAELVAAGGTIKLVQIYTIARRTTESYAEPLSNVELDRVADAVRWRVTLPVEVFYGVSP